MDVTETDKRSIEDFGRWRVDLLKEFLRKRGLKCKGKKAELVALAFSAEFLGLPVKLSKEEVSVKNAIDYQKLLTPVTGTKLPDPVTDLIDGWLGQTLVF